MHSHPLNIWHIPDAIAYMVEGIIPSYLRHITRRFVWGILLFIALIISIQCARFDLAKSSVFADISTHVGATLSLVYDHDLRYEPQDYQRLMQLPLFAATGPEGIFLKRDGYDQWYYAKPFLYPVFCWLWVWCLGINGMIYANGFLFWLLICITFLWLQRSLGEFWALILVCLFFFFSHFYPYLFVPHPDLLVATLMVAGFWCWRNGNTGERKYWWWMILAGIFWGAATYERMACGLLPLLLIGYMVVRGQGRQLLIFTGVFLLFSMGIHWVQWLEDGHYNPYQGERFAFNSQEVGGYPFQPGFEVHSMKANASYYNNLTVEKIGTQVLNNLKLLPRQVLYFFVGRQTGILIYTPIIISAVIFMALVGIDGPGWVGIIFIVLFWLLHVLVTPENPFGGATSLGNRYIMQVIAVALLTLRPTVRPIALWARSVAILLPLIFAGVILYPILWDSRIAVANHMIFLERKPLSLFPLAREYLEKLETDLPADHVLKLQGIKIYRPDNLQSSATYFAAQTKETLVVSSHKPLQKLEFYFTRPAQERSEVKVTLETSTKSVSFNASQVGPDQRIEIPLSAYSSVAETLSTGRRYFYQIKLTAVPADIRSNTALGFFLSLEPIIKTVSYEQPLKFGLGDAGGKYLAKGWGGAELWGTWTVESKALVLMQLPEMPRGDVEVSFYASAYVPVPWPKQRVYLNVNGQRISQWTMVQGTPPQVQKVKISKLIIPASRLLCLEFECPDAKSPQSLGETDRRTLGLALGRMWVRDLGKEGQSAMDDKNNFTKTTTELGVLPSF